jgi:uncharacterized membrane protein YfcA
MTPFDAALVGIVAFLASIVGGLAGYGTNLLMPIVLVPLVGAEATIPILAISGLMNNASRLIVFRDRVEWRRVLPLTLLAIPFCVVGAWSYAWLSAGAASIVIGAILIAMVPARRLLKRHRLPPSRGALLGAGALYGVLTGGSPGAGIVLVAALTAIGLTGPAVVATDSAVSLVVGLVKVATFQALGELPASSWLLALLIGGIGFPGVLAARWLGERMSLSLHAALLDGAVLAGGGFLLLRGVRSLGLI